MPRGLLEMLRGFDVMATSAATLSIGEIARRNAPIMRELARFSFPDIAALAGGLLTYPENQPATFRLEAFVALAAIHARGVHPPRHRPHRRAADRPRRRDAPPGP
jgi:hypothetical protein